MTSAGTSARCFLSCALSPEPCAVDSVCDHRPASIRRPAKSTCCLLSSGCPRIAATTTPVSPGRPHRPLTPRDPTATADTCRIEPPAGSPDPCHGRDTALLTAIRSTRRTLTAHRRRQPPATRGPNRRTTQGLWDGLRLRYNHRAGATGVGELPGPPPRSVRISTSVLSR